MVNLAEGFGGLGRAEWLACMAAAVVFGALHLSNDGATPLAAFNVTLLGLLFGSAFVLTGSLSLSMGLHFAWNLLLGPVFGLPVSGYSPRVSLVLCQVAGPELWIGGGFGPEGGLLATLVLAAALSVGIATSRFLRRENIVQNSHSGT